LGRLPDETLKRDRVLAAGHESAHAVVAADLGLPVGSIDIDPPPSDEQYLGWSGKTAWEPNPKTRDERTEIIAALAGAAYERTVAEKPLPIGSNDSDWWDALCIAEEYESDRLAQEAAIFDAWPAALAAVSAKEAEIEELKAAILENNGHLTGEHVVERLEHLLGKTIERIATGQQPESAPQSSDN
jgi:hypothetical protein